MVHNLLLLGSDNLILEIADARASTRSYFLATWISYSGCFGRERKSPEKDSSSPCSIGIEFMNCALLSLVRGDSEGRDSDHSSLTG